MNRTRLILGAGADRLAESSVAVFGVGGVGGYVAEFLARAGVGHIALIDSDIVEQSNLNRQIIALNSTLGEKKVAVCARRLRDINPRIKVGEFDFFFTAQTAFDFSGYDLVLDCIDTVTSKVANCGYIRNFRMSVGARHAPPAQAGGHNLAYRGIFERYAGGRRCGTGRAPRSGKPVVRPRGGSSQNGGSGYRLAAKRESVTLFP